MKNRTKNLKLSVIIVAKNEELKINDSLESVNWADEIIFIDNGSTDKTAEIAKRNGAMVFNLEGGNFSDRKNFAYKKATGAWILFIDADERVTSGLKDEIEKIINSDSMGSVFAIPRLNVILGYEMKHGGWWPDYVIRLFRNESFLGFSGLLHEQPKFKGKLDYLENPLKHIKHSNFEEMLVKTNKWSEIEAKLMFDAGHPSMNIPRFTTAVLREAYLRLIKEKAYMDKTPGVIYALYQVVSRFLSYAKLWEMQQKVNKTK